LKLILQGLSTGDGMDIESIKDKSHQNVKPVAPSAPPAPAKEKPFVKPDWME
jgi:hypothetical protein